MALPLICVFNPITTLIDQISSAATGPAAPGTPVVTNTTGLIDPSFLGTGSTTTAGETISNGQLVNLYSISGSLHAQLASAQSTGTAPSGSMYPVPAQGFASSIVGSTFIVNFFGIFVYIDGHSEFSTSSIGATVYLSAVTPGGVTLTPPVALAQTVGTVVGFTAPNIVTVNFGLTATPSAGGSNTAVQYNSSGTFAGDTTNFFWNDSTKALQIGASGSSAVVIKPLALTFFGSASGSASIGVPAAAGAPNQINLPTTTGTAGQVLSTDGGSPQQLSWISSGGGTPSAPNHSIQFNDSGAFGGTAELQWNSSRQLIVAQGGSTVIFIADAANEQVTTLDGSGNITFVSQSNGSVTVGNGINPVMLDGNAIGAGVGVDISASGTSAIFINAAGALHEQGATVSIIGTTSVLFTTPITTFSANVQIIGEFRDGTNSPGTSGQVLTSTATSTAWVTGVTTVASTSQKSETAADANVLTFTPLAVAGSYRVRFVLSVSTASAAVLGWTASWTDSNGNAQTPTNLALSQIGATPPGALTFTLASGSANYYGHIDIDVDNSATNIVVQFTLASGTIAAKASATIERLL